MMLSTPHGEGARRVPEIPGLPQLPTERQQSMLAERAPMMGVTKLPELGERAGLEVSGDGSTRWAFADAANERVVFVPVDLRQGSSVPGSYFLAERVVFATWN